MSERELVPKSSIGELLHDRFQQNTFRHNPSESPMARALVAQGYKVCEYPLYSEYTNSDWLASRVSMRGLKIVFRQPTPEDLLVCFIEREASVRKFSSPLLGITAFFSFCRYECPELKYVGGYINKMSDANRKEHQLKMDRLIRFYNRMLGYVESYEVNGLFSIYADLHRDERYEEFPIWKKIRKG